MTFQEILRKLSAFWEKQGCIIHQGFDLEVGAGTFNPATFLRCLGPEPYRAAYIEPCRRPSDGRYGENPNRMQHYFQYQVVLKPSPLNMQELYIQSLEAIGLNLSEHDIRFVHDDWENPTIGAWGLGWEVWLDGMEVTQYTYFQSVGGETLNPVTGELTYGIERLAMYLQDVDSIFDLQWSEHLKYGDLYHRNEVEWSHYNFEEATTEMWFRHFNDYEKEAKQLIEKKLPLPAYEFVVKSSHAFNILDARGAISVTERAKYIGRIRRLAKMIAQSYLENRETLGFPLLKTFPKEEKAATALPALPEALKKGTPKETRTLFVEIGSEELPATFVSIGIRNLHTAVEQLLKKENLSYQKLDVYGTPRRLVIIVEGLPLALSEQKEERRGPSLDKAYDSEGNATRAAIGFFQSLNIEAPNFEVIKTGSHPQVSIKEVKGKEYLFASITKSQQATAEVLAELLPACVLGIDFPKQMRWSDLSITYPRPLKWLVALFGEDVIPMELGPLQSSNISQGHPQLDRQTFPIPSAKEALTTLKKHFVMVDPKERERHIIEQLDQIEKKTGLHVIEREKVLKEVINLTEWPTPALATFKGHFLKAPKEVLISEMVEHQKYFPVAKESGALSPHFVITADTTPTPMILKGNQKVLSSRLSDGVFLYEKGLNNPLDQQQEKLSAVTFLSGMGTLQDKVHRLLGHIEVLQSTLKISTQEKCSRAALLCKSDLVSEMVFEFPELQGTIGRYYALHQNEEAEVATAIEEQWMPRGEDAPLPETATGQLLSLSDKLDNLICCFAAGLKPSSSSDPHALRRQTLGVIKILIKGKYSLPFKETLEACCRNFIPAHLKDKEETVREIEHFFANRMKTTFREYGFTQDEVSASISQGFSDIYDTYLRVKALHAFRSSGDIFDQLYEVYKRAKGQINTKEMYAFSEELLQEDAEKTLYATYQEVEKHLSAEIGKQNYSAAFTLLASLQPPLARLFDEVHILTEDEKIQKNRIALLQQVFALFAELLDFSQITPNAKK